jgi:hypothetical protein
LKTGSFHFDGAFVTNKSKGKDLSGRKNWRRESREDKLYLDLLDNARRSIMDAEADVDGRSLSVPLTIKSNFNLESTLAQ